MLADMLLVKVASWKPGVIMSKRYGMIFRNAELVFATCVGFGYLACAGVNLHGMPNQRIRLFIHVCVCVCEWILHWRADNRLIWHRSCEDVTVCRRPHVTL